MRRVGITFLVFIFFLSIGFYITAYQPPFLSSEIMKVAQVNQLYTDNEVLYLLPQYVKNGLIWDLIDYKVFYAWLAVLVGTLASLVSFLHLFIDKLFFRKFYEQPSLLLAIRRGIFVGLFAVGSIYFRLINGWEWYNLASLGLLFIAFEVLVVVFAPEKKKS